MRNKSFNQFLRTEAQEHEGCGGAATPPAAPVTPAAEAPPAPAAAAAPPREPTLLEKVSAAVRGKADILAESAGLRSQVEQLTASLGERDATITTLQTRIGTLEQENSTLQADFTAIDTALKDTEAKVVSIDTAAARQVAGMGFEPAALPAAEKESESLEAMEARLGKETDPEAIVTLARKIDAIKAKQTV